jgi:hypothetical protein
LVPVRRRSLTALVAVIAAITTGLCVAHYMAVSWPSVSQNGELARPLRLDRPDSFGHWFSQLLLLGSAGVAFLIYQLRRHRLDDFRGHYRLWRLVLVVLLLANLSSVVSMVDWSGAILEALIGKRQALRGADWIRIGVSLGGAVLALRLIAEVRRSRAALAAMLLATALLALPEAVKWNMLSVETIQRWLLVTAARLLAYTALFLSLSIYLRQLYREVRGFDQSDAWQDRLQQIRLRVFRGSNAQDDDQPDSDTHATAPQAAALRENVPRENAPRKNQPQPAQADATDSQPRRGWFRKRTAAPDKAERAQEAKPSPATVSPAASTPDQESASDTEPKPRRRWLGLRSAKPASTATESTPDSSASSPSATKSAAQPATAQPATAQPTAKGSDPVTAKRKFGLAGFRRQREDVSQPSVSSSGNSTPPNRASDPAAGDQIDPENIDWEGLSKAEKRRLRKQIKRQGAA